MSAEENIAVLRRWLEEGWQAEDPVTVIEEILSPDFVFHLPKWAGTKTKEDYKQFVPVGKKAFPDIKYTLDDAVAVGDKVGYVWSGSGTHQGEFMGISPTGKKVDFRGSGIAYFANGKIVKIREDGDWLGMLQELGGVAPTGQMETNKAILKRWVEEGWNQRKALEILDEVYSPGIVYNSDDTEYRGYEDIRQFYTDMIAGFPDIHNSLDMLLADGDKVVSRHTLNGTHQGEFFGIAPTGNKVIFSALHVVRIADGKMVEGWQNVNFAGLMQQLSTGSR